VECSADDLLNGVVARLYEGITESELDRARVMVARQRIEREPDYTKVATRLMLDILYRREPTRCTTEVDEKQIRIRSCDPRIV
jgi:ribonucleoside-diphosphate reductase alpha chain